MNPESLKIAKQLLQQYSGFNEKKSLYDTIMDKDIYVTKEVFNLIMNHYYNWNVHWSKEEYKIDREGLDRDMLDDPEDFNLIEESNKLNWEYEYKLKELKNKFLNAKYPFE